MAELKTKKTNSSVDKFIESISDFDTRNDCWTLLNIMKQITKAEPQMWGESIIGFGNYHYKYESGREGDWFITGFSPRKQNLTLYMMTGFDDYESLLKKLGKHKTGKSCLYIHKLDDVDINMLKELISKSYKTFSQKIQK